MVTTPRTQGRPRTKGRRNREAPGNILGRGMAATQSPSPSGSSIKDITEDRSLEGVAHAWVLLPDGRATLKLPGDREVHLVEEAPGLWVLREGAGGKVLMTVTGVRDVAGAMGSVVFRALAEHPRREVRAVQMLRSQWDAESRERLASKGGDIWLVPSATRADVHYSVDVASGTCSCPDNSYRRQRCKHLMCVEMLIGAA